MAGMATAVSGSEAFRTLYDANRGRVRRLLARMVGPQDADDLLQAVFAKAARALPAFRGEAQASTWLHRIAVNVACDWLRSRSTQEAKATVSLSDESDPDAYAEVMGRQGVDSQPSPELALSRKDLRDCLAAEIAKLAASDREVLMLSAVGGLGDEEIARTLGINKGAAKVRLHRARLAFRKVIEARCDFYRNELACKPISPDCCALAAIEDARPDR